MASRRPNPQAIIEARRKEEEHRNSIQRGIDASNKARGFADWEVKSAAGFASRADQKRTREARERELANLEARRRSLAALLAADERQYKTELDALAETPEQARARLMAKAQGLKDARENARAALAQEKLTQRMRDNMDELRTQVSAVFVKQCMEEGQRQLEFKENLAAKNLEIETKWARLWEWDRIQKGKREERELAERERLNAHTKQVLDEQTAMRERMRNANNGERDAELRKFAEIARIDAEKQAKREEAMAAAKRTAQREILKFNTDYEAGKAAQKAQQLAEERAINAAAAASLAGEGAQKEAEKQARMEDMKNYTSYLNKLKQDQAFMDAELDRMRAIAQEQAWETREQKWSKERAAREALMRDVQETIHEQLAYRAREKISQTQQGKLEQQKIQTELDRLAAKEAAKQQADMEWRQQANRELLQQMADRERARQEEFDAGVRAAAEEKARQDRIAAMLAAELVANKPVKTNFPIKSMKWYT